MEKTITIDNKTADTLIQLLQGARGGQERREIKELNEVAEEWLTLKTNSVEETTIGAYRTHYKGIAKQLGQRDIADIKRKDIQLWLNSCLDRGLKRNTVIKYVSVLKLIMDYAIEEEYINSNPCLGVKLPRVKANDFKEPATQEQYKTLLSVAKKSPYWFILPLLYYTGCRIGEALALTWDDVDFENRTISINKQYTYKADVNRPIFKDYTKTMAGCRVVIIHNELLPLLKERYEEHKDKNKYIMYQVRKGGMITSRQMQVYLSHWCDEANINGVSLHSFRHSATSNFLEMGISPNLVASMLGHSNVAVTLNVYSRKSLQEQDIKKITDTMDKSPIMGI